MGAGACCILGGGRRGGGGLGSPGASEQPGPTGEGSAALLLCIQESPFAHLEMLQQTLAKAGFYGN